MTHSILHRVFFTAFILTSWAAQPPAARAAQCGSSCGSGHRVCTMQARTAAEACLQGCGAAVTATACKAGCVRTFRQGQAACRATRADCVTSCPAPLAAAVDTCSGPCSGNADTCFGDTLSAGKACLQSCPTGAGLAGCWEQCAAGLRSSGATCLATLQGCLAGCQGPVSGACFDTIAMQCTAEACTTGQACSQPNEFCSPRCAAPAPGGACFDPSTMQCTAQPCSASQPCPQASQACVPACPAPPPNGKCFDTNTQQCTDQACTPGARCGTPNLVCTLQCPPFPTPAPQCSSLPCGGRCVISPPCPPNGPCPEIASLLGQCTLDTAGSCQCVPTLIGPTPTPQPTPMPQCASVPCGGPCIISPCPPGALCPNRVGQCVSDTMDGCQCVPVIPTPAATPTPQCTGMCAGPCTVTSPPFPCPPDKVCNGPDVSALPGQCEMDAAGGCECVPIVPTPAATPTPQCGAVPCGGQCLIAPPCPLGAACPAFVIQGACQEDASGTCACMPSSAPTPAPACATDADCDDGDGCTVDHCVGGMCEHACICLSAAGAPACCPGPAALCARPCGADAAGACGGTCPSGATCESLPNAQAACSCVSDVGGPCGGNILAPPPVCAPGLVCQQSLPDATGVCVAPKCIPLFTSGCSQTSDCCTPCGNGPPPCGVCINGTCLGAP